MGREMTRSKPIALFAAALCLLLAGFGCNKTSGEEEAAALSPKAKMPDATAADRTKAVNSNPNISPEVKKVIGGGSKGL
jgi:hypothetical protein